MLPGLYLCACLVCVQLAAGYFRTWRWTMWRWMAVVTRRQQLKELLWACFIMTNSNPRRRPKWQHNFMEGRWTNWGSVSCNNHARHGVPQCLCVYSSDTAAWEKGVTYAEGQNLARLLMEAPANHITPTAFANTIEEKLAPHAERVTIKKRFASLPLIIDRPLWPYYTQREREELPPNRSYVLTDPRLGSRSSRWEPSSVCLEVQRSPLSSWRYITTVHLTVSIHRYS